MKKYLLGVLLLLTFVATPVFVKASKTLTFPADIYSIPMADSYRSSGSSILFATVPVKKTFTVNSVYPLSITKPIYGLQISADISLTSPDSLIRVILNDKSNKDYLVFEGSPSIMEKGNFSIKNFCQETCALNGVIPVSLKIEVLKGSLTLNSVFTIDSSAKLKISSANTPSFLASKLNIQQTNYKISQLNNLNTKNGSSWVAGSSDVCNMTYDQKKQLFKDEKGVVPDYLPNLQGFDCYKGGVFSLAGQQTAQIKQASASTVTSVSVIVPDSAPAMATSSSIIVPDSWDWRNVNGENWMTPVKDQGNAGTCWAFSLTGAFESQVNLYYNKHVDPDLSEQMLVDCSFSDFLSPTYTCKSAEGYDLVYCKTQKFGFPDENTDPYAQRMFSGYGQCSFDYISSNWSVRGWKNLGGSIVYDQHNDGTMYDMNVINISNENELKKYLIAKGPLASGILSWNHAMVLEGYDLDTSAGNTVWIFKNSWGSSWGINGYGKLFVNFNDMLNFALPIGPFTPPTNRSYWPAGFDGKVSCVDKDSDNYCNWGISEQPPVGTICPATCKKDTLGKYIKDCDDSKNTSGPFISSTNLNCASISTPATTCTDSDGGKDPYTKGYTVATHVNGTKTTNTDKIYKNLYGNGDDYVIEWFCLNNLSYPINTDIKCQYGVGDGACLKPTLKAPTISFITPTKVNPGAKVSVYGTNFNTNTYVLIDGLKTIEPSVSGTGVLSFIVPTLTTGEYHTVQVVEKGSSFPASNSVNLFIWASLPTLTPTPVSAIYTCTDSDGGRDPYTKGYTIGYDTNGKLNIDYDAVRINPYRDGYNYVTEWYCPAPVANGSVYRTNTNIKCLYGSGNGVCLKQSTPTPIPISTSAPTLSSIYPTVANRGGTVSVYGLNFNANTYVVLSGYQLLIWPDDKSLTSGARVLHFTVPTSVTSGYHTVQVAEKGSSFPASNSAKLYVFVPSSTPTPDSTSSPQATPTLVPTVFPTPVPYYYSTPTPSTSPSPTPTPSPSPTPTPSPSPTPSTSPSPSPDPYSSTSPTPDPSASPVSSSFNSSFINQMANILGAIQQVLNALKR